MIKTLAPRRLPRLGIIRLGTKQTNAQGKTFPVETSYFVLSSELQKHYGERPTKLDVLFPSDDINAVLDASYIRYDGKLLALKCDGERFVSIPKTGGEITGHCKKPPVGPDGQRRQCECGAKAVGRLNVVLVEAPIGVHQVVLGGESRLEDLYSELEIYKRTFGRLTGILFTIERVPTEVQVKKEDGSRLARTGYPVHIRCSFTARQALAARRIDLHALPGADGYEPSDRPQLPAAGGSKPIVEADDDFDPGAEIFDVSAAFVAAKDLGVDHESYAMYLRGVYKVEVDNLSGEHLEQQREMFEKATSEAAKSNLKLVIEQVAAKIRKLPAGQGRLV
jgi:hypothetical protein